MKCDVCVTSKDVLRASSGGAKPTHDPETRHAARQKLNEHYKVRCQFQSVTLMRCQLTCLSWDGDDLLDFWSNLFVVMRTCARSALPLVCVALAYVGEGKGYNQQVGVHFLFDGCKCPCRYVVFMSLYFSLSGSPSGSARDREKHRCCLSGQRGRQAP